MTSTTRMFGRQPRTHNPLVPHWQALRAVAARRMGAEQDGHVDYTAGMPANLGMMLNGYDASDPQALQLGCCSMSAIGHAEQVMSFRRTGKVTTPPNSAILANYERLGGYRLGVADTDRGVVLQTMLAQACKIGFVMSHGIETPVGFMEVDYQDFDSLRLAQRDCEFVYLGSTLSQQFEDAGPGDYIDAGTLTNDGHCTITAHMTPGSMFEISWGFRVGVSKAAAAQMLDEAYVIFFPSMFEGGRTPMGLTLQQVEDAMQPLRLVA